MQHRRTQWITTLTLIALGTAACSRSLGPGSPVAPPTGPEAGMAGPAAAAAITANGTVQTALGYAHLHVNAELEPELTMSRDALAQGDQSRLGARPWLTAKHMIPTRVTRGTVDGQSAVIVTVAVSHPFALPEDLLGLSSTVDRIDLHAFKVVALVLADGSDAFAFPAEADNVITNPGFLLNASGYLKPAGLLNLPGFNANTFPYRHVTPLDAASAGTNYNPTAGGWADAALMAPTGYGVLAQGSTHEVDFAFAVEAGETIDVDLAVLAEYSQPKRNDFSNPIPKPRLPDPADPNRLRYILPAGAGDNSQVLCEFPDASGNNLGFDGSTTARMIASIVDWDNQAPVAASWPNFANLSEGPETSGTASISAVVPGVVDAPITGPVITGGTGYSDAPIQYEFTLSNLVGNTTPGTYPGLLRVQDEQAGSSLIDMGEVDNGDGTYGLGAPIATLPTVTYQTFSVVVDNPLAGAITLNVTDPAGQPLDNGDRAVFIITRTSPSVPAANWHFNLSYSGALTEGPIVVGPVDLTAPYVSSPSLGLVTNPTRVPRDLVVNYSLGNPSPILPALPVTVQVNPNVAPTCPTTQIITDPAGIGLDGGELIRVAWSAITDPDDSAALTVAAAFDVDDDGVVEEVRTGPASAGSLASSTATAVAGETVRVTLTISDSAGSIPACAGTAPVYPVPPGGGPGPGPWPGGAGNLMLSTLTTGSIPRAGTSADQVITGVRLTWGDVTGETGYRVYRGIWPDGALLSDVAYTALGSVGANVTSFDDLTVDRRGNRYAFRVYPLSGATEGSSSELAVVALQSFEGVSAVPQSVVGPTLANDWVMSFENAQTSAQVVGANTLIGTRSLEVTMVSPTNTTLWCTFSGPIPAPEDLALLGTLTASRLEFVHTQAGPWNNHGGMTVMSANTRPPNGNPAPVTFRWAGASATGFAYNDTASNSLDGEFPGLMASHSGSWNYGNAAPSFVETFSAFNGMTAFNTLGHRAMVIGFADRFQTVPGNYRLDDIAWIIY